MTKQFPQSKQPKPQGPVLTTTFAVGKRHTVTATIQKPGAAPLLEWTPPRPERLNNRERHELAKHLKLIQTNLEESHHD